MAGATAVERLNRSDPEKTSATEAPLGTPAAIAPTLCASASIGHKTPARCHVLLPAIGNRALETLQNKLCEADETSARHLPAWPAAVLVAGAVVWAISIGIGMSISHSGPRPLRRSAPVDAGGE